MITVDIPGSKSYTNRALLIASLVQDRTIHIQNILESDDTVAMLGALSKLGVKVEKCKGGVTIQSNILSSNKISSDVEIDCHMSGTTARFLTSLCAILPRTTILTGEKRLCERPIGDLVNALNSVGAKIEYLQQPNTLPIKIVGNPNIRKEDLQIKVPGKLSSQFLTSILMICPVMNRSVSIKVDGELVSKSYANMTIQMMRDFGVDVMNDNYRNILVKVNGYHIPNDKYIVEGDFSSAGYFFALSAILKKKIRLNNLNPKSLQGDKEFMTILIDKMGLRMVDGGPNYICVLGSGVRKINVNMQNCPDQAQTMAVLCAFAKGKSTLTGVRTLRLKETERVKAIQNELAKIGIITDSPDEDTLVIFGGDPKPATIRTYNDHRMAMSFAIAKAMIPTLIINNPEVVKKTFPSFWKELKNVFKSDFPRPRALSIVIPTEVGGSLSKRDLSAPVAGSRDDDASVSKICSDH